MVANEPFENFYQIIRNRYDYSNVEDPIEVTNNYDRNFDIEPDRILEIIIRRLGLNPETYQRDAIKRFVKMKGTD